MNMGVGHATGGLLMRGNKVVVKLIVGAGVTGALVAGTMVQAKGKPGPLDCPRDILCPDIYDPVMCDQGMFPNACYAYAACATNCSGGGGGI